MRCWILLCSLGFLSAALPAVVVAQSKDQLSDQRKDQPKPVTVATYTVTASERSAGIQAVGQLLADEQVVIRPEIAGRIAALDFREGGAVRSGQVLLRLEAAEPQARLREREADVNGLEDRLKRAESLFAQQFVSEQAVTDARQALGMGRARLDEMRAQLEKSVIRAPFSGVVGFRQVSLGAYVKEGEDIVTLSKVDVLKLDVRVPETRLGLVKQAKTAVVEVDAWPGERFQARLQALSPSVDSATRTLLVRALVKNDGRLKPGMFARVTVDAAGAGGMLRVPEQVIVPKAGKNLVFRVEDGVARAVPVRIGRREPGWAEVSGLHVGDVVVSDGQIKLKSGAPVSVGKLFNKPVGKPAGKPVGK